MRLLYNMAVSGIYPHIMHGEAWVIVYPAFSRFTDKSAIPQYAILGRILNSDLANVSEL